MKNKSILFGLLATTALMLGACNKPAEESSVKPDSSSQPSTTETTSSSAEESSSSEEVVDYGSLEAPISVAAANVIINRELEIGTVTQQPLVVKGVMKLDGKDGYNKFYKNYTFYLHDEADDNEKVYAYQISNLPELEQIASENDTIIISGYVVEYKGTYELTSTKVDDVKVEAYVQRIVTVGTSTITVAAVEHGTVSELPASAANGTPAEFTLTPEAGYKAGIIRVNGVAVEPDEDGKYKFVVNGDTTVRAEFVEESKTPANYGSEEAPLSVAEALALATEECYDSNIFTAKPVVVKGLVKATKTLGTYSSFRIDVLDEANPEVSLLVYTLLPGDYTELPAGYTIIISGYIKNYNTVMEYDVYYAAGVAPTIISLAAGTVAITVEAEHATVTGLPETAEVGTELSFTVEAESGYRIDAVKANDKALTPEEGVYKFVLAGPTTIKVETSEESAPVADKIIIDTEALGLTAKSYADNNGEHTVGGIRFETTAFMKSTYNDVDRMQLQKANAVLLNLDAIAKKIEKIEVVYNYSGYNDNKVTFEFADECLGGETPATAADTQTLTTVKDQLNYTITPKAAYSFFKLSNPTGGAHYIQSITIVCVA